MAGEFTEFFTELMFGSGAWFGLALFIALSFVVSYKARYSSGIWLFILLFLNFEYWGQLGGEISLDNNFVWSIIISYIAVALMGFMFYKDITKKG